MRLMLKLIGTLKVEDNENEKIKSKKSTNCMHKTKSILSRNL